MWIAALGCASLFCQLHGVLFCHFGVATPMHSHLAQVHTSLQVWLQACQQCRIVISIRGAAQYMQLYLHL